MHYSKYVQLGSRKVFKRGNLKQVNFKPSAKAHYVQECGSYTEYFWDIF
jgi:hypothetical protein